MRSATFLPTPGARLTDGDVPQRDGVGEVRRRQRRQNRERHLGADALHVVLQQPEPFALERRLEAVEPDHVLAHIGLDEERHRLAGDRAAAPACAPSNRRRSRRHARRRCNSPRRSRRSCPSACRSSPQPHHRPVLTPRRAPAALPGSACDARGRWRWPAHRRRRSLSNMAFGISTFTIMWICCFSPWPTPMTAFLTALGAYSATVQPGKRRHQHGDAARLAELQRRHRVLVDEGLLDRRLVRRACAPAPRAARHATGSAATASAALSSDFTVPEATKRSELPSVSTTPQPVRRSPGSMPMMRIALMHCGTVPFRNGDAREM